MDEKYRIKWRYSPQDKGFRFFIEVFEVPHNAGLWAIIKNKKEWVTFPNCNPMVRLWAVPSFDKVEDARKLLADLKAGDGIFYEQA